MSVSLTPSKRSHDENPESNGNKLQKTEKESTKLCDGSAFFRVLCPASKIDRIVGNDSDVISQICEESGAEIKMEEPVPECDERVIFITETGKKAETSDEQQKNDGESADVAEEKNDDKESDKDKQMVPVGDLVSGKGVSSAQKALLLVIEKLTESEQDLGNENEESGKSDVTLRLLVLSSQVGFLLGEGDSGSKKMSDESGAEVQVLPRDKVPSCASSSDEVVEITGNLDAVKKAVKLISEQIIEDASRDNDPTAASTQSFANHATRPEAHASHKPHSQRFPHHGGPRDADLHSGVPSSIPKFREGFGPNRMNFPPEPFSIRLLCPDERVGGLIGKGGAVIKALKHETGCDIKVIEYVPGGEDQIIVIAGPVHPEDRIFAVQDAALRVHARIAKVATDSINKTVTTKVLVSSNQIGCLLGKGGAVVAEMRKATGANIWVLGKDQYPQCASENLEVVQITGDFEMVQQALVQITARLRNHYFRDNLPPFMGRREFSPPGVFRGPSFHHFDSVNGPGFHPQDGRPPFMHDMHRPGIPHMPERQWGPQALFEGGPMGSSDFIGGPPRRMPGFGGGNQPTIINTKVEVVVPSSVVPSIYGEDGGCLQQIRQISEAKITITDPKPGVKETTIIISGNPEETHAAQSLIQAFVISETEAS